MATLSVVISAFNEEKKLGDCLESVVEIADEIIVVDNSSTDKTAEIAKKYTKHIFTKPNNPMLNTNKNFGFTKATSDWILNLDADERVSPELAQEISQVLKLGHSGEEQGDDSRIHEKRFWTSQNDTNEVNGYWIPRKNIIFGKWIEHAGWYPDKQLRLFRNGMGKFAEKHVHEMIIVDGDTESLSAEIIHYNYETVSQFLYKAFVIYAPNEADQLLENGYQFRALDAIAMPAKEFTSRYFARQGYKDGLHGLVISLLMGCYHLVVFANIWEKKQFVDSTDRNFVDHVSKEFNNVHRDIKYWAANEKLKHTDGKLEKYVLRVRRKIKI